MANWIRTLLDNIGEEIARRRNRPFLEASMAACALVATADGEITFSERSRLDEMVKSLDQLESFDPHEAVELFNQFAEPIAGSPEDIAEARRRARETVGRVASDSRLARLIARMGVAMSRADGHISPPELAEIDRICKILDLDPSVLRDV